MSRFHLVIDSDNCKTTSSADISTMLMRIRKELLELRSSGQIYDANGQCCGEWSYEMILNDEEHLCGS